MCDSNHKLQNLQLMFDLTAFPSLMSQDAFKYFAANTKNEYAIAGFNLLSEPEQKTVLALLKPICDYKALDLNAIFSVQIAGGMIPKAILAPKVYHQFGGLQIKIGNNFVPLNFDAEKSVWYTPAKTPLTLTTQQGSQDKVDYPVFQLGAKLLKIYIGWKDLESINKVKNDLISLLVPPSDDLDKYIKNYPPYAMPLYSLIWGADKAQAPFCYRVIDVERTFDKTYGEGYLIYIHGDDLPDQPLFSNTDLTGSRTNCFRASNSSKSFLQKSFDNVKAEIKKGQQYWIVVDLPLGLNGDNFVVTHAFFPAPVCPMEQRIAIPYKEAPAITGTHNPVIAQLKAAVGKGI
jgi:hypothetical protein